MWHSTVAIAERLFGILQQIDDSHLKWLFMFFDKDQILKLYH